MSVADELDKQKLAREAASRGLEPWQLEAERAAPTSLVRDLVADAYRGRSDSASLIPNNKRDAPARQPSGGSTEVRPPDGIGYCDAIAESFARRDRAIALQQQMELDWIETRAI